MLEKSKNFRFLFFEIPANNMKISGELSEGYGYLVYYHVFCLVVFLVVVLLWVNDEICMWDESKKEVFFFYFDVVI